MDAFTIAVVVFLTTCSVVSVLTATIRRLRIRCTRRWITKQQAPITQDVGVVVERRLAQRSLASGIASLIGLGVGIGLLLTVGPDSPDLGFWFVIVFGIAGGAVGSGIPAFHAAVRPVFGTVRVAHSSAGQVGDFVNPTAVRLIRGSAALAALTALTAALLPFWRSPGFGPDGAGKVWVGFAVLVLMWAAAEFAIRRILDQPRSSANAVELVWDDAIRSQLIADLLAVPCSLAIGAAALAALADASTVPAPVWTFPFLIGIFIVTPITIANAIVVMCLGERDAQSRRRNAIAAFQGA